MFSGELKARASKLEREQRERDERERQKREKERLLLERQRRRLAEREAELAARRQELQAAEQREAEERQAALEANRGVYLKMTLAAAPADEAAAVARGIRRWRDKLVLPPSAGAALMAQDAPKNGAMFFEVTAQNGASTHAGVLDFTAPEGVVLVPTKVAESLFGLPSDQAPASTSGSPGASRTAGAAALRVHGSVTVTYKRLPKGSFVRLQPELHAFHEQVGAGEEARAALEAALLQQATLTEGDWVHAAHGGREYALRVLELQPAAAVSVIDTDIAADVGPSIEVEGYLRARQEAALREAERLRQLEEQRTQAMQQALEAAEAREQAAAAAAAEEAAKRLRVQQEAAAALPAEPAPGEPHFACVFRLPDGARVSRRWKVDHPLQSLYDFVDAKGAGGLWPGQYRLVTQFPRRVLPPGPDQLSSVGLAAGQHEAILLEPLNSSAV